MSRFALLTGLLAVGVAAQTDFTAPGFKYIGCIEAAPGTFGVNVDFFKAFSADECQTACGGKGKYAALGSGCHCDDPASSVDGKYNAVDESLCSVPCIDGNSTSGHCGGPPCSESGKMRYNLYQKNADAAESDADCDDNMTETPEINTKLAPAPSTTIQTITSCPPEGTDCPLSTQVVSCPPEGCGAASGVPATTFIATPAANTKIPAESSAEAAIPSCPEKCGPPCPVQGCTTCPPGGCLPACPPGCPMTSPQATGCTEVDCGFEPSSSPSPACPSGGCSTFSSGPITTHVLATGAPMPSSGPGVISQGSRFNSGALMAVVCLVVVAVLV